MVARQEHQLKQSYRNMGRGWKLFEALKDVVSPEDILEEMARNMSDQELLDAVKEIAKNFDVEL